MGKTSFREFIVKATVHEADAQDFAELETNPDFVRNFKMSYDEAAGPIGKDGKPRMLLITTWMAHEGRNLNGQVFIKVELEQKVRDGLFSPPHAGMIDFDHDFDPRGFWYNSSFAYDQNAEKWGIILNGAIWAWRFDELSNMLLAEMQREGFINVSMSALPGSLEVTHNYPGFEDERTEILHNPVFFTTSVLDIPPADPDAKGTATEEAEEDLLGTPPVASDDNTLSVSDVLIPEHEAGDVLVLAGHANDGNQGGQEMDKELDILRQELEDAKTKLDETEASKAEVESQLGDAEKAKIELAEEIDTMKVKISELEVALQSVNEMKEQLEAELAQVREELEKAREIIATFEAEKAEREKEARFQSRMAELPDVVKKNLEAHEDSEVLTNMIRDAEEDQWAVTRKYFDIAVTEGTNYTGRSDKEGGLPTSGSKKKSSSVLRQHIK
jgi:hypothetical protein